MFGNVLLTISILMILHAAFSTYEHLSVLKAAGRPSEGGLPADIVIEALFAFVLGTVAATIRAPELKEITWRSEMKKRYVDAASSPPCFWVSYGMIPFFSRWTGLNSPLEEIDPRMSFTNFAQRAGLVAGEKS
ncbi:hypothetical protein BC835DRAFT_1261489 [Cytidiella melzeri]|nr:hypothetical protein BC835DRAFT_1261489 [Cytidiella melzeri]